MRSRLDVSDIYQSSVLFEAESSVVRNTDDRDPVFQSDLAASMLQSATKEPSEEGAFSKDFIPAGRTGKGD